MSDVNLDTRVKGWEQFGTVGLIRKLFERMLSADHTEKNSLEWNTLMKDAFEIELELRVRLDHTNPEGRFDVCG